MALQSAFTLTANEIYNTLANMIISQQVFADNVSKHQTLVDKARVDGTLYGDTKLYYATDVLKSVAWGNDAEASNLLSLDRAEDPEVQAIKLDIFRQIRLTVDNYLTKRAFADEGTFASFNSVMLGWMSETKKIYDGTLYNVFIGTTETNVGKQIKQIDIDADNNSAGENIAKGMADLFTEMSDYTRDFNDYGFLRSYGDSEIKVIWNAKYLNAIKKIDLPSIFHDEALQSVFVGDVLPARYFGRAVAAGDKGSGKVIGTDGTYDNTKGTLRVKTEKEVTISTTAYHLFPGDEIPNGATVKASGNFEENEVYVEDDTVICKVVTKLPPYMSAFETGTSFFNPRSLTENHYLTFRAQYFNLFKELSTYNSKSNLKLGIIYKHTSPSGKCYIGQTIDPLTRWDPYRYRKCPKFNCAIKKYGWNNIKHEVLCIAPKDLLDNLEIYLIKYFNSFNDGYNSNEGGDGNKGHQIKNKQKLGKYKHSEEQKRKTSESCKNRHINVKHIYKYNNNIFYGSESIAKVLNMCRRTFERQFKKGLIKDVRLV